MDTRITCSVKWIRRVVCREIQGTLPEPVQPPKRPRLRTANIYKGARGTNSRGEGTMMNPRQGPSSLARLATHSLLSTSGDGASLCCSLAGLSCISSSRTESCPSTTHPRTRTGPLPGRSPSQSVVCICGDPSLTANAPQNAVWPPPLICCHTLSLFLLGGPAHTHMPKPARTHNQKSTLLSSSPPVIPPAPLPALAL